MDTGYHSEYDTELGDAPAETSASSPPAPSLSLEELEARITELAGHLNAANYRWLLLITEFDRRKGWADGKLPSCAHWLNFKCGLNLGAAREKVRVGHALGGIAQDRRFHGPWRIELLQSAGLDPSGLRGHRRNLAHDCASRHRLSRRAPGERVPARARSRGALPAMAQQHTQRSVNYWFAEDGSLILRARLPAAAGALLIQALDAALEAIPQKEIRVQGVEERWITYEARRADALAVVAEGFLGAPCMRQTRIAIIPRIATKVVVHVDAGDLLHAAAAPGAARSSMAPPSQSRLRAASPAMQV